jgi:hypothetical protein
MIRSYLNQQQLEIAGLTPAAIEEVLAGDIVGCVEHTTTRVLLGNSIVLPGNGFLGARLLLPSLDHSLQHWRHILQCTRCDFNSRFSQPTAIAIVPTHTMIETC